MSNEVQRALADLIEGEMEYVLRHHAEDLAKVILAAGYSKATDRRVISTAAVEAVARLIYDADFYVKWEDCHGRAKARWRKNARAALEAAAPLMLVQS